MSATYEDLVLRIKQEIDSAGFTQLKKFMSEAQDGLAKLIVTGKQDSDAFNQLQGVTTQLASKINSFKSAYIELGAVSEKTNQQLSGKSVKISEVGSYDYYKSMKQGYLELANSVSQTNPQFETFIRKAKEADEQMRNLHGTNKKSSMQLLEYGENMKIVYEGIKESIGVIIEMSKQVKELALAGAEVANMKKAFAEINGGITESSEKMELLKKAASGTYNDKEIYEYVNRMDELNYTTDESIQLLDLAHEKHESLGISIQRASDKMIQFIETGRGRGLYKIGMDAGDVALKMQALSGLTEKEIKDLDLSAQQTLRKQAVLSLYGRTMDEIIRKEKSNADTIESANVAYENAKLKIGELLSKASGLIEFLGLSKEGFMMFIIISGGVVAALVTIIGAVMALTIAFQALNISTGGIISIIGVLVTLGVTAGLVGTAVVNSANSMEELSGEVSKTSDEVKSLKSDMESLQSVYEQSTSYNVMTREETENYNKTLDDLVQKFPGIIAGYDETNGRMIVNSEVVGNLVEALKNEIDAKEKLIELDQKEQINKSIDDYSKSKEDIDSLNADLTELREHLKAVQDQQKNSSLNLVPEMQRTQKEINELTQKIARLEIPTKKAQYQFQELIKQGLKVGDVGDVMQYLNIQTQNSADLQGVLKNAVVGLSNNFITEYTRISQAVELSALVQKRFANAMALYKAGAYQDALEEFNAVLTEAKEIEAKQNKDYSKKPKVSKSSTPKEEKEKEPDTEFEAWKKNFDYQKGLIDDEVTRRVKTDSDKLEFYNIEFDKLKKITAVKNEEKDEEQELTTKISNLNTDIFTLQEKIANLSQVYKLKQENAELEKSKSLYEGQVGTLGDIQKKIDENNNKITYLMTGIDLNKLLDDSKKLQLEADKRISENRIKNIQNEYERKYAEIDKEYNAQLDMYNKLIDKAKELRTAGKDKEAQDLEKKAGTIKTQAGVEKSVNIQKLQDETVQRFLNSFKSGLTGFSSAFNNLLDTFHIKGNAFSNAMQEGFAKVLNTVSAIQDIFTTIKATMEAIDTIKSIIPFLGLAEGGVIRGPGSMTSDSIPIMVSDWEFIMPGEQTKKYLPLLNAMRAGSFDKLKFSTGGLVNSQYVSSLVSYYSQQPYATPDVYVDIKTEVEDVKMQKIYRRTLPKYFKRNSNSQLSKN